MGLITLKKEKKHDIEDRKKYMTKDEKYDFELGSRDVGLLNFMDKQPKILFTDK